MQRKRGIALWFDLAMAQGRSWLKRQTETESKCALAARCAGSCLFQGPGRTLQQKGENDMGSLIGVAVSSIWQAAVIAADVIMYGVGVAGSVGT
jgi:hypothetical protein